MKANRLREPRPGGLHLSWAAALLVAAAFLSILVSSQDVMSQEAPIVIFIGISQEDGGPHLITPEAGVAEVGSWVVWDAGPAFEKAGEIGLDACTVRIMFDAENPFTPETPWEAKVSWPAIQTNRVQVSPRAQTARYEYEVVIGCPGWDDVKRAELLIVTREEMLVTTTLRSTTTITVTIEVPFVPPIVYVFVAILVPIGAAVGFSVCKNRMRPPVSDFASFAPSLSRIEGLGEMRALSRLHDAADVEKMLGSVKEIANKTNDALRRLKAARAEKEAVEALVEFAEQVRNASADVGSFTEFLAERAPRVKEERELGPWFNVLTVNLLEMERALDNATITVRPYPSGAMLFEALGRNFTFLRSTSQKAQRAFTLADTEQINVVLSDLRKAKSQLDAALSGVSRGLADWYGRLSWQKYVAAAASLVK